MPQLDTIHTFMIYLWTWSLLYLMVKKMKTVSLIKTPKNPPHVKNQSPTLILPWI